MGSRLLRKFAALPLFEDRDGRGLISDIFFPFTSSMVPAQTNNRGCGVGLDIPNMRCSYSGMPADWCQIVRVYLKAQG